MKLPLPCYLTDRHWFAPARDDHPGLEGQWRKCRWPGCGVCVPAEPSNLDCLVACQDLLTEKRDLDQRLAALKGLPPEERGLHLREARRLSARYDTLLEQLQWLYGLIQQAQPKGAR